MSEKKRVFDLCVDFVIIVCLSQF